MFKSWLNKLLGRKKPPILQTQWGPVTEWCRKAAAQNMREDPEVMERVLTVLERETGSREEAEKVARERYPEAFIV